MNTIAPLTDRINHVAEKLATVAHDETLSADALRTVLLDERASLLEFAEQAKTTPLSIGDAVTLGMILQSCQKGEPITWLVPDGDGRTISGTARSIVKDENGAALMDSKTDVRDGYIWISATFEHFIPVRDAIEWVNRGEMALNYRA